jgi:hypothetical protein
MLLVVAVDDAYEIAEDDGLVLEYCGLRFMWAISMIKDDGRRHNIYRLGDRHLCKRHRISIHANGSVTTIRIVATLSAGKQPLG